MQIERPSNNIEEKWTLVEKKIFDTHIKSKDFSFHQFVYVGAKGIEFKNCDFSFSFFERSYFRNAKFIDCKFIGTKFYDCNFFKAQFSGCNFKYSIFRNTLISHEQVLDNLPEWPNVKRELLRAHRVNAESIGDIEAVKVFIRAEMDAQREHLKRARERKESFYSKHYKGIINQTKVRWKSFWLWLDWVTWGHGEYPFNLLRFIAVILFLFSILILLDILPFNSDLTIGSLFKKFMSSLKLTTLVFLGIEKNAAEIVPLYLEIILALLRYTILGLWISVLFRRLSKR